MKKSMHNKTIVTFGEIMGRLDIPHNRKFVQGLPGSLEMTFAGAEANVAMSVTYLGATSRFVTALPNNDIGEACVHKLRGVGIDVNSIIRTSDRLGTYYVETGANQRPSKVIYDRAYSAVSLAKFEQYDWEHIFADASWFHVSGITPALSKIAAENTLLACKMAQEKGITVSCDLNFRKKLWQWDSSITPKELAQKTMPEILKYVDVLIANEEDASDILGISPKGSNIEGGDLDHSGYVEVAQEIMCEFPSVKLVATTLRESISASHNNWGAMVYDKATERAYYAPMADGEGRTATAGNPVYTPYEIHNIIDRVGGGDSFAAGLIYALNSDEYNNPEQAVQFAVAASCLCHSIQGDFNYSSKTEVELLMKGNASGRVQR